MQHGLEMNLYVKVGLYLVLIYCLSVTRLLLLSAVDCGNPGKPINGDVVISTTTFESEVYYACNTGYFINGMNRRFCQANGTWSGHLPSCQSM